MTDQLGNAETYTYDTSDNLISVTDRKGQSTTYTYDVMKRLKKATYNDGSYTDYTYDTIGRLTTITDSVSGAISYTYSDSGCSTGTCGGGAADKVIKEVAPLGTIDYTYDAIGRRTSMTVAGQQPVSYQYDANSRLTSVVGAGLAPAQISYDALGRRTSLTLPNGVKTNYNYDEGSRLLNLQHLNPVNQVLEALTYSYDATGNRISMNRQSVTLPLRNEVSNTKYNEANQMLRYNASSNNIKYDKNGNMISITNSCGATKYTWDVRNRLVKIKGFNTDCTSLTASFKYDALGRRTEKTIKAKTTQYLYDGLDIVQEIKNGVVSANYIRTLNIDEPLTRIKGTTVRYYQTDALGSVIALTDKAGAVRTQYSYDPFGGVTASGEASDNPFQYTGRENDGTGLYYYRFRYYSPGLQRFVSKDPLNLTKIILLRQSTSKRVKDFAERVFKYALAYPQLLNEFGYVVNNPGNYIDPLGLISPGGYTPSPGGTGSTIGSAIGGTIGAGLGAEAGFIVGGPPGAIGGGVLGGWAGGTLGGGIGGFFDPPCAGQLNCNEPIPPQGPPRGDPYCPPGNDWCCN